MPPTSSQLRFPKGSFSLCQFHAFESLRQPLPHRLSVGHLQLVTTYSHPSVFPSDVPMCRVHPHLCRLHRCWSELACPVSFRPVCPPARPSPNPTPAAVPQCPAPRPCTSWAQTVCTGQVHTGVSCSQPRQGPCFPSASGPSSQFGSRNLRAPRPRMQRGRAERGLCDGHGPSGPRNKLRFFGRHFPSRRPGKENFGGPVWFNWNSKRLEVNSCIPWRAWPQTPEIRRGVISFPSLHR